MVWIRKLSSKRERPNQADVLLLIEVSDSSLQQDLGEKAEFYASHGVPEYWVVDIAGEQVHVHQKPLGAHCSSIDVYDKSASIAPLCQPHAKFDLRELFDLDASP